jgi:hypothetical protein
MRNESGVPQEIGDLSPVASSNRPYGSDIAFGPGSVNDDHMRAMASFIAQLHARVQELEKQVLTLSR